MQEKLAAMGRPKCVKSATPQHLAQLSDEVRAAVLANAGTVIAFRVGAEDAESLAPVIGEIARQPAPDRTEGTPRLPQIVIQWPIWSRSRFFRRGSADFQLSKPKHVVSPAGDVGGIFNGGLMATDTHTQAAIAAMLATTQEERVPDIGHPNLPAATWERCQRLRVALHLLNEYISALQRDLALLNYAKSANKDFIEIAYRDAAMNLWHFGEALTQIRFALRKCDIARSSVTEKAVTVSIAMFEHLRPSARVIRDVNAHSATHKMNAGREDHRLNGQVLLHGDVVGNSGHVAYSYKGQLFVFNVDQTLIQALCGFRRIIYDAFRELPRVDVHLRRET